MTEAQLKDIVKAQVAGYVDGFEAAVQCLQEALQGIKTAREARMEDVFKKALKQAENADK